MGRLLAALVLAIGVSLAAAGCGDGTEKEGASGAFCTTARQIRAEFNGSFAGTTPGELERDFTKAEHAFGRLQQSAPRHLEDDVRVLARAFRTFHGALERAGYDPAKLDPASARALSSERTRKASDALDAYGRDVCGMSIEGGTTTAGG